jgi:hypothetical protein
MPRWTFTAHRVASTALTDPRHLDGHLQRIGDHIRQQSGE